MIKDFLHKILTGRRSDVTKNSPHSEFDRGEGPGERDRYRKDLTRAKKLKVLGRIEDALKLLETLETTHGPKLEILSELASLQMKIGDNDESRDTYLKVLQNDIGNLDAIENFLELNYSSPAPQGTVTGVITELSKVVPKNEEFDAEAAVFLLPSLHLMAPADEGIRRLKHSQSATARYISLLATSVSDDPVQVQEKDPDLLDARIVVSLVRGQYEAAKQFMAEGIGCAGLRALKQAIQRELRAARTGDASELLSNFMAFAPDNAWARSVLNQITRGQQIKSRHQLTVQGFPFPDFPVEKDYQPNPRKILYLLHNSLPHDSAGYAIRTHGLLSALRSRGWLVQGVTRLGYPHRTGGQDFAATPLAKSNVIDGNKYHRLLDDQIMGSTEPLEDYVRRYSDALYNLAVQEKPAIIHAASNHWNGLAAVIVARRLGIPSIYEVRGLWEITELSRNPDWGKSGAFRFMERMETDAAHAATRVVAITTALKDELVKRGVPASKITVVPNAVDPSRFKMSEVDSPNGASLGLAGKTVIGYVGSLVDYEGLSLLIDAISRLSHSRDDFRLLIVGDGPELRPLQSSVSKLGLTEKVIFTGAVSHRSVASYYELIDVIALPRLSLPVCEIVSPLKPFEAMASGKALVASDVAALSEIIRHGETGLLHEKDSVSSLSETIEVLLDRPDFRRELGRNALKWVREERTWSQVSGAVVEIYDHLISESNSDMQVLNDLVSLETLKELPVDLVYEIGRKNLQTYFGRRLLVHSALKEKSSRYSLRVVKLFAEYGLWELVSYLARHALPSAKDEKFVHMLRSVLSRDHNLRKIALARVSVIELTERSQLSEAIAELLVGPQLKRDQSVLSPVFLVVKLRNADTSLVNLAITLCEYLGIQLILEGDSATQGASRSSNTTHLPALNIVSQGDGSFRYQRTRSEGRPAFWHLGALSQKEIVEVAAIHWLLAMQTSTVLKLQRTKWRGYLVESVAPILPLDTIPGAFKQAAISLKNDPQAEGYVQRASSALLRTGHYRGASELLTEISPDRQDTRYGNRLVEAAFGTADFRKVMEMEDQIEKTPRMNKIISESGAALRILQRLESTEPHGDAPRLQGHPDGTLRVVSILHASAPDQTGGYANRAHALLRSLSAQGIEVRAFTRPGFPNYSLEAGQTEELLHEDVIYHRIGSNLRREAGEFSYMEESIAAYRAILESEKPDVVHLRSTYVSALPGLIAARELSIPTLYEVSGMWELVYASYGDARREGLRARTVRMENEVLSHADRIVTLTEAMASEIRSRVSPKSAVTLVPNAVDVDRFKPQEKREDLKTALGWQIDVPVIGYAGSIVDYEGLDVLLRAADILRTKGLEFRVLIIGDGAVKSDLEDLSARLGLGDTVRFTGRLPHYMVGEYYTIFDICAFPRHLTHATRAVSPLKPFEALAAAKPIVVSDIPALSEIVGKTSAHSRGLAVEENNPIALSQALERLLTDPRLRETLSSNGLKWVRNNRSWGTVSNLFAEAVTQTSGRTALYARK